MRRAEKGDGEISEYIYSMRREEEEEKVWENMRIYENFYVAREGEVELRTSRIWDEFEMKIDHENRGLLEEWARVMAYNIELDCNRFIGNADPRDDGLDEDKKNNLNFSRNLDKIKHVTIGDQTCVKFWFIEETTNMEQCSRTLPREIMPIRSGSKRDM